VALPTETTTHTTYLAHYLHYFAALQSKSQSPVQLAVMVSDDTHDRTAALLEAEGYYGFPREQLTLMKQEKVRRLGWWRWGRGG
jgi:UDP-sugar pyrophosphorylase